MRGFPSHTPGLEPQTGVALGSQTVSPINMANAYATIANGGVAAEPFIIEKVVDADGEARYTHKVETHQAIGEDVAADVSYAMQQVVATGSGTAALGLGRAAAGKTGTATKTGGAVSSSWFAGYTPQLATAVMYVRGEGNGQLDGWLPSYFGGDYPAETWTEIMKREMEGLEEEPFPEPANLEEATRRRRTTRRTRRRPRRRPRRSRRPRNRRPGGAADEGATDLRAAADLGAPADLGAHRPATSSQLSAIDPAPTRTARTATGDRRPPARSHPGVRGRQARVSAVR